MPLPLEATRKASKGGTKAFGDACAAGPYELYGDPREHVERLEDGTEVKLAVGVSRASPTRQLIVAAC
ncbi:hypothetical protein GCM10018779_61660 [Streptomyces griseocarneus]|nr:hypothetical protein GCM10018779_61660 [Streptomyces griseocarneus]